MHVCTHQPYVSQQLELHLQPPPRAEAPSAVEPRPEPGQAAPWEIWGQLKHSGWEYPIGLVLAVADLEQQGQHGILLKPERMIKPC